MPSSRALAVSDFDRTRCATHPEVPGVAICSRCGDFHCARCQKSIAGRALCATCRGIPGVDYLEDTRQRFWGKRDGYTWYLGLLGPVMVVASLPTMIRIDDSGHVIVSLVWLGLLLAYFAQYRPMRLGLLVLNLADMFVNAVRVALGLTIIPTDNTIPPAAALTIQV